MAADRLAAGLGWFSIGLGLGEVLAPRLLGRFLGLRDSEGLLRAYGLREIGTGVAILAARERAPWIWGRVAGDALDIATLLTGLSADNPKRRNVALALAAVAGVTALDAICGGALAAEDDDAEQERAVYDYSDRTGFPRGATAMWGEARDFIVPRDFRTPEPLRPYIRDAGPDAPGA